MHWHMDGIWMHLFRSGPAGGLGGDWARLKGSTGEVLQVSAMIDQDPGRSSRDEPNHPTTGESWYMICMLLRALDRLLVLFGVVVASEIQTQ